MVARSNVQGEGKMRLNRSNLIVVVLLLILLGSAYVGSIYVNQLFNPFNRTYGQLHRLASLVSIVPIEGGVPFSVLASSSQSGFSVKINSSGSTEPSSFLTIGVYSSNPSAGSLKPLGAIDWSTEGPIMPGQSRNSPLVYLWNEGNKPVSLYLSTSRWTFRDATGNVLAGDYRQYFSLTWNYDYSRIGVGEIRSVIFTLTVLPGLVDVSLFSFDLVVTLTA